MEVKGQGGCCYWVRSEAKEERSDEREGDGCNNKWDVVRIHFLLSLRFSRLSSRLSFSPPPFPSPPHPLNLNINAIQSSKASESITSSGNPDVEKGERGREGWDRIDWRDKGRGRE